MSTQTEQTSTTAPAPQGSHHWVMTQEIPGRVTNTHYGTYTPAPGMTRHDVFMAIKAGIAQQHPELAKANVMFFSLEPNQL